MLAVVGTGDDLARPPGTGLCEHRQAQLARLLLSPDIAEKRRGSRLDKVRGVSMPIGNVLANRYASEPMRRDLVGGEQDHRRAPAVAGGARAPSVILVSTSVATTRRRDRGYEAVIDEVDLARSPTGSGSPGTTSRRGSRSSTRWPATSRCTRG